MKAWGPRRRTVERALEYQASSSVTLPHLIIHSFWSAGFGLGALNDADEDDLDVYDADIRKVRNRLAYDAKHDDTLVLGNKGNSSRPQMVSLRCLSFATFPFSLYI